MKIVWTRRQDQWDTDKKLFTQLSPIHVPLTQLNFLHPNLPSLRGKTIIISSLFAATLLSNHYKNEVMLSRPNIETFSAKVEQELKLFGAKRWPADSLADFAGSQWDRWLATNADLMFLGAKVPAFPLVAYLQEKGVDISKVDLYETNIVNCLDLKLQNLFHKPAIFCLASPSAVDALQANLPHSHESNKKNIVKRWTYVCIGPTTGKRCRELLGEPYVIERPDLRILAQRAEEKALANS